MEHMTNEGDSTDRKDKIPEIHGYVAVRLSAPKMDEKFILQTGKNYTLEAGFQLDAPPSFTGQKYPVSPPTQRIAFTVVVLANGLTVSPEIDSVYKYENGEPSWAEFNLSAVPREASEVVESEIRVHFMERGRIGRSFFFPVIIKTEDMIGGETT